MYPSFELLEAIVSHDSQTDILTERGNKIIVAGRSWIKENLIAHAGSSSSARDYRAEPITA